MAAGLVTATAAESTVAVFRDCTCVVDTPAPTTAAAAGAATCGSGDLRKRWFPGSWVAAAANLGHASSVAMASGVALEVRRQPQLPVSAMAEVEAGVKDRCVFRDSLVN